MMKKRIIYFFFAFALACSNIMNSQAAENGMKKAAFWCWDLNSSLLNQAYVGAMEQSTKDGFVNGKNIVIDTYNINKDSAVAATMLEKVKAGNYDVIVSIGTTGSKYLLQNGVTTTPVVFSVVTDPVKSGIVSSWLETGNNFTGTSNKQPVDRQIISFSEIVPNVKKLGIIYKDQESNSLVQVQELQDLKTKLGLTDIVASPAKDATDLTRATQELVGKVDAIFLPADTLVGSADADKIVAVANQSKIPVFSANSPPTAVGALTGLCSDYKRLGEQTWLMVDKIFNGSKPQKMPVEIQQVPDLIVNLKAAEVLGITIPDAVFNKVTKVIE